jgi:hypothetical protein
MPVFILQSYCNKKRKSRISRDQGALVLRQRPFPPTGGFDLKRLADKDDLAGGYKTGKQIAQNLKF